MDIAQATAWASDRSLAVLITIRADGRPQSSDIVYDLDGGTFVISVTDVRAKTANLRRDPRAVLHVSDASSWSYVSFDGTVELSPTASSPDDATCDALVRYYERVTGEPHPDWADYRRAMVDERRLVVRFTPRAATGMIRG
ncbi:MAG: PPOX class F420-dependent oxidoreductase [Acidimicrobiia bacterium]|nr:PPOX class F420-dependent oxidoreductase [Acidimicrobiia bacterium]